MLQNYKEHIVLFTRYPVAGKCKTRMIPKLGPEGAASLQKELTEHITGKIHELLKIRPFFPFIWYVDSTKDGMTTWLGPNFTYKKQANGSLGKKMAAAFSHSFAQQAERVVLIGSDCPGIDDALLSLALDSLLKKDVVLGPAMDGGYYLIGLHQKGMKKATSLFSDTLDWGQSTLFTQTLGLAKKASLSIHILEPLHDIDTPADLMHWNPSLIAE